MNPPETTDPLDALLREQDTYIEDAGFTARVITTLPRSRRRSWLRPALLLGATAIGSGLAAWWLPWSDLAALNSSVLLSTSPQALLAWVPLLAVAASLSWGVIAAIRWED
jgi:hypothetical protein